MDEETCALSSCNKYIFPDLAADTELLRKAVQKGLKVLPRRVFCIKKWKVESLSSTVTGRIQIRIDMKLFRDPGYMNRKNIISLQSILI
jgi:hypothetical protein